MTPTVISDFEILDMTDNGQKIISVNYTPELTAGWDERASATLDGNALTIAGKTLIRIEGLTDDVIEYFRKYKEMDFAEFSESAVIKVTTLALV